MASTDSRELAPPVLARIRWLTEHLSPGELAALVASLEATLATADELNAETLTRLRTDGDKLRRLLRWCIAELKQAPIHSEAAFRSQRYLEGGDA